MASSSNQEIIQITHNFNYQKELGKLFTENKDLQRQFTELNKKMRFCYQMLRQSKYQSTNREGFQDNGFAREKTLSHIMQTIHQKTKDKRNKTMKQINQLYCTQQGQIYRRKFYQGWELHEAITEANNIRMKKIFKGTQGHILLQEEEED